MSMSLNELLAEATTAASGAVGTEGAWQSLAEFTLLGNTLQMVERRILGTIGEDAVAVPAKPGRYAAECRVIKYDTDLRVSRMRVRPVGIDVTLGDAAGKISVDMGGIAIVDIDTFAPSTDENEDEYQEWLETALFETEDIVGVMRWGPTEPDIPFASGGFGGGRYPIYHLMHAGQVAGLEVEFIAANTPYPFGQE